MEINLGIYQEPRRMNPKWQIDGLMYTVYRKKTEQKEKKLKKEKMQKNTNYIFADSFF